MYKKFVFALVVAGKRATQGKQDEVVLYLEQVQ